MGEQAIPDHLRHWPGLFEWQDGVVVEAPTADIDVARNYPRFPDKGPVVSSMRLTVMSQKLQYHVGDEVRIIHVVEVVEAGRQLYVMGPKPVYGEYVDNVLVTPVPPDDMWEPATYNGPVLPSPAADYNYVVTVYRFDEIGAHTIQWRVGAVRSNVLTIEVVP